MTKQETYYILINVEATETRGCSSMVEHQPSKLDTWVRFPSPALCDSGVVGNARPCQGRDRGFEPRLSLLRTLKFQSPFCLSGNYFANFLLYLFFRKFFASIFFPVFARCETGIFLKLFSKMALRRIS